MQVDYSWLWLAEAARILRVHPRTLQRGCARGEVPHIRIGPWIKVHVSYLGWTPPPDPHRVEHWEQLALFEMRPVRVWRNSGKPIHP